MSELWDAYDREFRKLEHRTLVRGEPLPAGVYHLVSEVAVRHVDGTYLLMQRDTRKHYGGMWELTAGGSALAGETPLACALRELREETGLSAGALKELGRTVHEGHRSLYVEFLCVTDCPKDAIVLQPGETMGYRWVRRQELEALGGALVTTRMQGFLKEPGE